MQIEAVPRLQDFPAQLGLRQRGGQAGDSGQGAAGECMSRSVAEERTGAAAAEGGSRVLGQLGRIRLTEAVGKLHLPQQHAAQDDVLGHHGIGLSLQPGAELSVDHQEAADGAGQGRDGHHAAKQFPEKAQAPHPSNR